MHFAVFSRKKGIFLIIFVIAFFLAGFLGHAYAATTYYVDNTISDAHPSSSTPDCTNYNSSTFACSGGTGNAYATIADINVGSFSAGDSVLFRKGQTWREQLTVPSGGSSDVNRITYGAFGSGNSPIFNAADLFSSWTASSTGYYAHASTTPELVFYDSSRLTKATSSGGLVASKWWWDSANNRVYIFDNPSGHTVEVSQRNYGVDVESKNYVTVSGIEGDKANIYGFYCSTCTDPVFTGLTANYNYIAGLRTDIGTGGTFSYSTAAYNGGFGFISNGMPNLLYDHLVAHDNSWDITQNWTAGIELNDVSTGYWPGTGKTAVNNIVQYCEVYNNGTSNSLATQGFGIWADTIGDGWIARYNYVHDNEGVGIFGEKQSASLVYGNVAVNNSKGPSHPADETGGISLYMDCNSAGCQMSDSMIANNVAYNNWGHGIRMHADSVAGACTNNQVSNNIAFGSTWDNLDVEGGCENDGTNGSGNVYTYNDFGPEASNFIQWGSGITYSTYSSWESASGNCGSAGCSHSVQSDPLFVSTSTNNFALQAGSPAINAGTNLGSTYEYGLASGSSWPSSVSLLNQNSYGSGWEIGAYVYGTSGVTNMVTSRTTVTNSAPTISAVSLNHGNAIVLTPNATTSYDINYSVTDQNGCSDIRNMTSTAFRTGVSSTCAIANPSTDKRNCYLYSAHSATSCVGNTVNVTDTVDIYYFADSTGNDSSTYPSDHWQAWATAIDASNSSTATSSQGTPDAKVMAAINLSTSTVNYGSVARGENTSSTNQTLHVQNVGNSSTSLQISGTAFVSGLNSLATSAQHFATSSFTYGGGEPGLTDASSTVSGFNAIPPHMDVSPVVRSWKTNSPGQSYFSAGIPGVVYNGFIYRTGGIASDGFTVTSTVSYARINATGSVGSWTNQTPLPTTLSGHGSVAYSGYLYTIGGNTTSTAAQTATSTVFYAAINADGSVSSTWHTTAALPARISEFGFALYNGYFYTMGGANSSNSITDDVYYTSSSSANDGTLNPWQTATTFIPGNSYRTSGATYNGYLYLVGGDYGAPARTSTVFYAAVNATGSVGGWQVASQLPSSTAYTSAIAYNGFLYSLGGQDSASNRTTTVLYASLNSSGTTGSWSTAAALPTPTERIAGFAYNGYLYVVGGFGTSGNIYYTSLDNRPIYWGVSVSSTAAEGNYASTATFSSLFVQ